MPKPKVVMDAQRLNVRLTPQTVAMLKRIAERRELDLSATVRQLILEETRRLGLIGEVEPAAREGK